MQKTISLNFQGYWRAPNRAFIPHSSGIYLVYAGQNNWVTNLITLNRLIYIGEATNANQRVANHEKWAMWQRQVPIGQEVCFAFAAAGEPDRKRAEAALINKHKPACNTEYMSDFPYESTTVYSTGSCLLLNQAITAVKTEYAWPTLLRNLATAPQPIGGRSVLSDLLGLPPPIGRIGRL
jgi:hypothetical protein